MKPLVFDHCHATNQYRGLLCKGCNTGLGLLGDTLEAARRLVLYLERGRPKVI